MFLRYVGLTVTRMSQNQNQCMYKILSHELHFKVSSSTKYFTKEKRSKERGIRKCTWEGGIPLSSRVNHLHIHRTAKPQKQCRQVPFEASLPAIFINHFLEIKLQTNTKGRNPHIQFLQHYNLNSVT